MTGRVAPRRLGRPPAAEPGATRDRILHAARHTFAELGYAATTNKALADSAGVTTGAIYHYFDAKLDVYRAVHEDVQTFVYARFDATVEAADSFAGGMADVLDLAHVLNNEDPTLARFLGAVRIDVRRNPELGAALHRSMARRDRFIENLVDVGVASGELADADREKSIALVLSMLIGLVDAVSDSPVAHRAAVDAMKLLIEGRLVHVAVRSTSGRRPG